jgi:aminoglycoside phosphotransferase (APT) family kinase protein
MSTDTQVPVKIDKNFPPSDWIESLRDRYPCERETDRVLTRKMERRSGATFSWPTLDELVSGLESLLRAEIGDAFHGVVSPRWLGGGASKVQMYFDLSWTRPGGRAELTPMVLRLEPAAAIQESSRRREFQLLKAFAGKVPVPEVFWLDAEGTHFPYPALVCGFASGVTKPTESVSGVTGLGTTMSPELRAALGEQFVQHLATIHAHDINDPVLEDFDRPSSPREAVEMQLNMWERIWEEDSDEDIPLMRLAAAWLRANIPDCARISVVHADFRTGNFLYTEADSQISAILDWEGGHFSDPHEDLAYVVNPVFAVLDDDGSTVLVSGLMTEEEFLTAYEHASGFKVDRETLAYWKVFNSYKLVNIAVATAYRIATGRKTHQDVLVAWLLGTGPVLLESLRASLEGTM